MPSARPILSPTLLLLILLLGVPARAQAPDPDDPHAGCVAPPTYVPKDLLERPVRLRTGVGNSREQVTAASPEAQAFYDQGLNYLESYVWIEASRSFHQALRIDPKMAMAYVGLSRVRAGFDDMAGAKQYLDKAKELSAGISDRERRRIEIREKQLASIDDLENPAKFLAYKKAIDDALNADTRDPELWLLRGTAEESNASGRGQRGTAGSVAFYEQVLKLVPDHASAHHYLIHTYETIGQIDKALEHGEAYARLSPAIPHAAHMWAHDLRRVGRVNEAITQFRKADSLEHAYYAAEKLDPSFDWHHGHNLNLLASCYQHQGRMKLAEKVMKEASGLGVVDAYGAFNMREIPNFFLHRQRYKDAVESTREMTRSKYVQARVTGHALAGQALVAQGKADAAAQELQKAERELEQVPRVAPGLIPRRNQVDPWVDALRGELQLRTGKGPEGRETVKKAVLALRAAPGPDAWSQALFRLDSFARTAREVGDWELAEFVAGQMLAHDDDYGGSHLARALVFQHQGDVTGAEREMEAARECWRAADANLPELKLLRTSTAAKR